MDSNQHKHEIMKKSVVSLLTGVALIGLAMPVATATNPPPSVPIPSATDTKAPAADTKAPAKKRDTYPLYGEVVAVTNTLLTIKGGKDKPERKFDINKDTKIHNDEKPATIADVKVGAWVGGSVKSTATGNPLLLSLNVGVKQKDAAAPEQTKPGTAPAKVKEGAAKTPK